MAASLLAHADALADCGVARINVSLDTLEADKFRAITRRGDLSQVLRGIEAAERAGLKIKINTVALREVNEDEIEDIIRWAHGRGFDLTLIETMPMGEIGADRTEQYLPLSLLRARLEQHFTFDDSPYRSGGPARYVSCARDRRQARLHHAHDPQFLRVAAIACGSPAPARSICVSARRTRPISGPRSGRAGTTLCFTPPSMRPSPASPKAMTSSSGAANDN